MLRACCSVRFQGLTSPPEYRPSAPSRLRSAKRAALCLPDPCGLGSDSHDGKVFSDKLLKSLTQTGSQSASTAEVGRALYYDRSLSFPRATPFPDRLALQNGMLWDWVTGTRHLPKMRKGLREPLSDQPQRRMRLIRSFP